MHSLTGVLIASCIAIGAALAWQYYGAAARHIIVSSSQWAGWLQSRTAPIAYRAPDTNGLGAPSRPLSRSAAAQCYVG
jgi:hypothetical protein